MTLKRNLEFTGPYYPPQPQPTYHPDTEGKEGEQRSKTVFGTWYHKCPKLTIIVDQCYAS